ncbi:MAG TPA: hypothetical protein VHF25_07640 [Nitriliruptorales bacterium]|nr:hypothetical protein [Nitriliruptorales bacterium]
MAAWQALLLAFFVLLPVLLMLDFWGDERLTARGGPVTRPWPRGRRQGRLDQHAAHGAEPGEVAGDTAPAGGAPAGPSDGGAGQGP